MSKMNHMDMSSGSNQQAPMAMTFFSSKTTPLFSTAWKPSTTGQYIGTCLFIVVLGMALRLLLAVRGTLEDAVIPVRAHPGLRQQHGEGPEVDCERILSKAGCDGMALYQEQRQGSVGDVDSLFRCLARRLRSWREEWKFFPALFRATFELLVGGIAYLL
jgi:hypothetical protein